ncbi:MAG: gliding motility lipoprotein GldH [Bacteroidales bacterium]|jgi:gliding motility-associated lipoprotein GldH|nr:gliding motility lipoprotein GldH [Bacteroidales bacterium]MBQ5873259.1 gliding motility lipoprotein GldH [Bacteroidales bacterium]MEE0267999.1 gliding motility lipoprotein GldH [Bacteroidales bacterium]MEE1301434.1 gliding motility lipoprotein GldH [Bacteroidales bacterium]
MKTIISKVYILLVAFVFFSCNSNVVYDENKEVDSQVWKTTDKLYYEVEITDTLKAYKLAINIRNTVEYPYSNVYFYLNTILPNGKVTKSDTIECYLAYPDGTWKGKGDSKIKDNRFWIAKNVKFNQIGKYTFELRQATIDSTLKGICDVGLHLEYQD